MNILTNTLKSKIKYEYLTAQTYSNIHIGYGIDNNYAVKYSYFILDFRVFVNIFIY